MWVMFSLSLSQPQNVKANVMTVVAPCQAKWCKQQQCLVAVIRLYAALLHAHAQVIVSAVEATPPGLIHHENQKQLGCRFCMHVLYA